MTKILSFVFAAMFAASVANASTLINEFEPNPAGSDPSNQDVELLGTPGASFDLWILSLESDSFNGTVDRASNVTGSFDANGIAVVTIGDLENPSNTVVLTDAFTGSVGDDLDAANDGTLDLSSLGNILDAVGVSDNVADDDNLYGAILGGTDILYNGEFEPLSVFREATTGEWFNTVTVDFGGVNQHIGVFDASGSQIELDPAGFTPDPTATTFGAVNPSFAAIPEPSTVAMLMLGAVAASAASMRSRLG